MFTPSMKYLLGLFIEKNKGLLFGTILSSTLTFVAESVWVPRILGNTFSHMNDLKKNIYMLVLSWIVIQIGNICIDYFNSKVEIELHKFLNDVVFHHLFIKYQHDHMHIDSTIIIDTLTSLQNNMHSILYRLLISFLPRILTLFFVLINIISINKKLGYTTSLLLFIFFIAVLLNYKNKTDSLFPMLKAQGDYLEKITDVFRNVEWVSTTQNGLETEKKLCNEIHNVQEEESWKKQKKLLSTQIFIYVINIIIFAILLYYLYYLYGKNEITSDNVTKIILAISPLFVNMYDILWYIPEFIQYLSMYHFYEPFLSTLFSFQSISEHHVQFDPHSTIHVSNLSFLYGDKSVYDSISISIPSGSFVTLRGNSGSGKSTFLKLLGGILRPSSGTIMIDGHNIHDVSLVSLYKHMLYLHQHPTLFNQSILYNISYGLDVKREQVEQTIREYELETYLPSLDKQVGKGGENISGGQRQLIHLLRCLFSSANIFLLDESMSAMDESLATKMINILKKLNKNGKTILLISHHETVFTKDVIEFHHGVPTFIKK
jgi:ABC-type bacteriocin/lantibiotic exporter with double-glycine peptidase domain